MCVYISMVKETLWGIFSEFAATCNLPDNGNNMGWHVRCDFYHKTRHKII